MVFVVYIIRLRTWRMSHVLTFSLRIKDIQFQTYIESKWVDFFDMLLSFTHTPTTATNAYFMRYASTIKRVFQQFLWVQTISKNPIVFSQSIITREQIDQINVEYIDHVLSIEDRGSHILHDTRWYFPDITSLRVSHT